ncbi:MAG: SDR family oxidoreductase [Muribaculaceae bacterium]|nr:SDR family oxidoreductase [Muribaculaceae bacterium]
MKEIALVGTIDRIFGDVLGQLLKHEISVNAMVDEPEKLMIDNSLLTVSHLDATDAKAVKAALEGYDTAVLVYNDNLRDVRTNDLTLRSFAHTVAAAREAGVKRVIVVGSENSEAFFVTDLRRMDDIDWLFISNVGPYAKRVRKEIEKPQRHSTVYED